MKNKPHSIVIDYRERAPLGAQPHLFYRDEEAFLHYAYTGYRSICVPGMVAGARTALTLNGTMNISEILKPVIKLANEGFTVTANFNKIIVKYYNLVERNRATSNIFLPDWLPLQVVDLPQDR